MTQSAPVVLTPAAVFCGALELSAKQWRLAFSDGERIRQVSCAAGDFTRLAAEVVKARKHFRLPDGIPLFTCYEAGRDGFWIHRQLKELGVENVIVDPSSIQVNRRARRAKTDSLDAISLARLLVRHVRGERGVWQVVRVPSLEEEDARRVHRERERLTVEKTQHLTRIRSLLALHGLGMAGLRSLEPIVQTLSRTQPLLAAEIEREEVRLKLVLQQLKQLDAQREALVMEEKLPSSAKVRELQRLRAIGPQTATVLVGEFFGWREFKNRKQVGSCAGLTPTHYSSGTVDREQGISKAGSRRIRRICVEVAWGWLRYQPESRLSQWFNERFGRESGRSRRLGIVALARKLLIALWEYTERGVIPEGALMKA